MTNGLSIGGGSDFGRLSERIDEINSIAEQYNLNVPTNDSILGRIRGFFSRPSPAESLVASNISLLTMLRNVASIREHERLLGNLEKGYLPTTNNDISNGTYNWAQHV